MRTRPTTRPSAAFSAREPAAPPASAKAARPTAAGRPAADRTVRYPSSMIVPDSPGDCAHDQEALLDRRIESTPDSFEGKGQNGQNCATPAPGSGTRRGERAHQEAQPVH